MTDREAIYELACAMKSIAGGRYPSARERVARVIKSIEQEPAPVEMRAAARVLAKQLTERVFGDCGCCSGGGVTPDTHEQCAECGGTGRAR